MCRATLWCRSPVHQVVTTGVERTSFVFFYYPNFEATLPAAVGDGARAIDDGAKISGERLKSDAGRPKLAGPVLHCV